MTSPQHRGFSIRIHLVDGTAEGLRVIEKSNWTGRGIVCPRSLYAQHRTRDEFDRAGVYILSGPSEEAEQLRIYIGEGDPVRPRLDQHNANRDFWTNVTFFVSKDDSQNKAHIQYLESRLVKLANDAKRCQLDNGNSPQLPSLSQADIDEVEGFLDEILLCLPVLGIQEFEQPQIRSITGEENKALQLNSNVVEAVGYDTPQGFVVVGDSHAVLSETPAIPDHLKDLRADLVRKGILVSDGGTYRFTQTYMFNSPSTAAGVLLGYSVNGRTAWHDENGRTLRDIQTTIQ